MTIHPLTPRLPRPCLTVGQAVHVNAHAAWLPATVVSIAHTAVAITLHTQTATRTRTVAPWVIRPADGHRLEPVHRLRHGDEVVAADGTTHTIAAVAWQGADGWWVITYASGQRAALPAGAVLRLIDTDPEVTVDGTAIRSTLPRR
jgi:hypothetical protein